MSINSFDDISVTGKPITFGDAFLSERIYKEVLARVVIPCVDVIFHDGQGMMYLTKRIVRPMEGYWIVGGRLLPSDLSPLQGIMRVVELETGVKFSKMRFTELMTNYYRSDETKQGGPGACLTVTYQCKLYPNEVERVSDGLDPREYDVLYGLQPHNAEVLSKRVAVHPALILMWEELFKRKITG